MLLLTADCPTKLSKLQLVWAHENCTGKGPEPVAEGLKQAEVPAPRVVDVPRPVDVPVPVPVSAAGSNSRCSSSGGGAA